MAKQTSAPQTDFDDELEEQTRPAAQESTPVAKDEDGVPYCAKHHCRMKMSSGGKAGSPVAYYKCPVDGCEEKGKRMGVLHLVPTHLRDGVLGHNHQTRQ